MPPNERRTADLAMVSPAQAASVNVPVNRRAAYGAQ